MFRPSKTLLHALITVGCSILLVSPSFAQLNQRGDRLADSLVHWDSKCFEKGCLMQTEVLRGHPDGKVDPNDAREYVGITLAFAKQRHLPATVIFGIDPRLRKDQGVWISFMDWKSLPDRMEPILDADGLIKLEVGPCTADECAMKIPDGIATDSEHPKGVDLLNKFLTRTNLVVIYESGGQKYTTMILLASFKKEYARLVKEGLTVGGPS